MNAVAPSGSRGKALLVAFISWLLFAAAVPPVGITMLALVGLVPWLVYLRCGSERGFFLAYFLGIGVYGLFHLQWVWEVTGWAGPGGLALLMPIWWFFLMPLAWPLRWCLRRGLPLVATIPLIFTAGDFLREWIIGGISWHSAGYAFADWTPLIQIAEHGRVWPLTLLAYASNAAIAECIASAPGRRRSAYLTLVGVAVIAMGLWFWGAARIKAIEPLLEEGPRLVGIQANVTQEEKLFGYGRDDPWHQRDLHVAWMRKAAEAGGGDLVIWPETSLSPSIDETRRPADERRGVEAELIFNGLDQKTGQSSGRVFAEAMGYADNPSLAPRFIIGSVYRDRPEGEPEVLRTRNAALHLSWDGSSLRIDDRYFKRKLVPGGEYMPLRDHIPGRESIEAKIRATVNFVPDLIPGEEPARWTLEDREGKSWLYDLNICFEMIYPALYAEARRGEVDFIVNISNDAWYGRSAELDLVHRHAKFRAVESRLSIFRVSNTGISTLIDPLGREVAVVESGESARKWGASSPEDRPSLRPQGTM